MDPVVGVVGLVKVEEMDCVVDLDCVVGLDCVVECSVAQAVATLEQQH